MTYQTLKKRLADFLTRKKVRLKEIEHLTLKVPVRNVADMGFVMVGFQYVSTLDKKIYNHELEEPIYYDFENEVIIIPHSFTSDGFVENDEKKYLPEEIRNYVRTFEIKSKTTKTRSSKR